MILSITREALSNPQCPPSFLSLPIRFGMARLAEDFPTSLAQVHDAHPRGCAIDGIVWQSGRYSVDVRDYEYAPDSQMCTSALCTLFASSVTAVNA